MKIIYSNTCLEYKKLGHPESPERVKNTFNFLKEHNFEFIRPKPCPDDILLLVHEKQFVDSIKNGNFYDIDTPNLQDIYEYAKLSVGSSVEAMKIALDGERTFSLMRPPGHHSGIRGRALGTSSLGFCYFNNIAIASRIALDSIDKVAIIDIDCHHGNGTQEIFLGNNKVLYVSLHKLPEYPGTGEKSEKNCLNYPLSPDTTEKEYIQTLKEALEKVKKFNPSLIAVSAGFDAHKDDPVTGGLGLETKSFREIAALISSLKKPSFAVLEGGYGEELPMSVYEFLKGFS